VVRVIRFGESVELCGGTHVSATGRIGFFKIVSEGAISAGVRRIEAVTGERAVEMVQRMTSAVKKLQNALNSPDVLPAVERLITHNGELSKKVEEFQKLRTKALSAEIENALEDRTTSKWYVNTLNLPVDSIKEIGAILRGKHPDLVYIVGTLIGGKPSLVVALGDNITAAGANAGAIVKEAAKQMQGGGGGQASIATAGGKNPDMLGSAIDAAVQAVCKVL
ncbi:MAG: alanine--tRNA ligase, partial [Rikenellaceae bacterium]|nr:alanine--tRNA ligase [Rikenellaceae bacterium]